MKTALLVLASLLGPAADDARLQWDAPASCPEGADVRAAVVELAGRWPTAEELWVDARVRQGPQTWELTLTVRLAGRDHRRELTADSCASLARATALIVAVSIDPVASASEVLLPRPAPQRSAPEPDAGPVELQPATRDEGRVDSAPARVHPLVGVGWGVVLGMTPGISSGPMLSVGAGFDRARVDLIGRYVLPRSTRDDGAGARVQAGVVAARACLASRPRTVRGHLCGGVEAGAIRASGLDVGSPRTPHFPWLSGAVGGGLRWRLGRRLALATDVEGTVAAIDAQVVVGDAGDMNAPRLFASPRVGLRATLGLEFDLFRPSK